MEVGRAERSQAVQVVAEIFLEIVHYLLGTVGGTPEHGERLDFRKRGYPRWKVSTTVDFDDFISRKWEDLHFGNLGKGKAELGHEPSNSLEDDDLNIWVLSEVGPGEVAVVFDVYIVVVGGVVCEWEEGKPVGVVADRDVPGDRCAGVV